VFWQNAELRVRCGRESDSDKTTFRISRTSRPEVYALHGLEILQVYVAVRLVAQSAQNP